MGARGIAGGRAGLLAVLVTVAALLAGTSATATHAARKGNALSSCMFRGPITTIPVPGGYEAEAFPDTGAIYWSSRFSLPDGARLVLRGRFAHARYQSLNSYGTDAAPTDALNDVATGPDRGSSNPFRAGARRDARRRSYAITVVDDRAPGATADRRPNTLYAGVPGQSEQRLIFRIYLPDRGRDLTGGVGLPRPEVRLADGRVRRGPAACAAIGVIDAGLPLTRLPRDTYLALRDRPGTPPGFPARNPPRFGAFYNTVFSIQCAFQDLCGGRPARVGGQYSNIDNTYVAAFANRGFGRVLVLRGRLPTTPSTQSGERRMAPAQLRYWSICQNESLFTTLGAGCLYDAQVPVDRRGVYTIVTARSEDRPANATRRCGVGFIPWPRRGDGAGHANDALLIVRNMLPAPGFEETIHNTRVPGDEGRVMRSYLPRGAYTSEAAFERRGCAAGGRFTG